LRGRNSNPILQLRAPGGTRTPVARRRLIYSQMQLPLCHRHLKYGFTSPDHVSNPRRGSTNFGTGWRRSHYLANYSAPNLTASCIHKECSGTRLTTGFLSWAISNKHGWKDSNPRHAGLEAAALTRLSYTHMKLSDVAGRGAYCSFCLVWPSPTTARKITDLGDRDCRKASRFPAAIVFPLSHTRRVGQCR
jgi:hypothetical protein